MKAGNYLELFTALPTSCPADQSQSYSSAGGSSGGAVKEGNRLRRVEGVGATAGVGMWKGLPAEMRL